MTSRNIYYICPDMPVHSGGISMIYDHVITLNKLGFNAYVVHFNSQFKKIPWRKFGKDISFLKIHYLDKMFELTPAQNGGMQLSKLRYNFKEEDVIVIPEGFPQFFPEFKQKFNIKSKMIMFAQGWLYIVPSMQQIFQGQVVNLKQHGCSEVISVGTETLRYVKDLFQFTDEELHLVPDFVDLNIFNMNMGTEEKEEVIEKEDGELDIQVVTKVKQKKDRIAFMPRKGMEKWYGIFFSLCQALKVTNSWEFVPIINMSQEQVAETLKDSKIFVNFTEGEGFGLPALESLLCGCLYVGNAGLGSLEFLDNKNTSFHREINDCNNPYEWVEAIRKAIEFTTTTFYDEDISKVSKELSEKYTYDNFVVGLKKAYESIK